MGNILIVEDDEAMGATLRDGIEYWGTAPRSRPTATRRCAWPARSIPISSSST